DALPIYVPVLPEGLAVIGVEDDHGGAPEVERALELEEPLDLDVDERDLLVVVRHPTLTEPGGEAVLEVGLVDVEEIGPEEIGPVDHAQAAELVHRALGDAAARRDVDVVLDEALEALIEPREAREVVGPEDGG